MLTLNSSFFTIGVALVFAATAAQLPLKALAGLPPNEVLEAKTLEEFKAALQKSSFSSSSKKRKKRRTTGTTTTAGDEEEEMEYSKPILADAFGGEAGFYHGVASGDPLSDRVILWTRFTPVDSETSSVALELRLAEVDSDIPLESHLDPALNDNIRIAKIETSASSDFIAKVDVLGLKSNTHYVYAFTDGNVSSEVGQTRTAPSMLDDESVEEMTYAFFSCSEFVRGYFHSYDVASTIENLDFWIHVGDYIYEYGSYAAGGVDGLPFLPDRVDINLPQWECVDLQDYRNRYAAYHQFDEGLRNLRRRAPLIAIWDDHEMADNTYGQDSGVTGAVNHQEVCSANRSSTDEEKTEAHCDRDEGDAGERWNVAAQAYMEWMPIRRGPNTIGIVQNTSITQVIEWGDLASIVAVDTRLTARSAEPTTFDPLGAFASIAYDSFNISAYYDETSETRQKFNFVEQGVKSVMNDPSNSMIGEENKNMILDTFENSKSAGKPWQIFAAAVVMGPQTLINLDKMSEYAPPFAAAGVKAYTDAVLSNPQAFLPRAAVAMDLTNTPYNSDQFDGFAHEREMLLKGFLEKTNNAIVLGGDSHDSWAYTLYEKGVSMEQGKPAAVNLGAPGVTNLGVGYALREILPPLENLFGGAIDAYKLASDTYNGRTKGLKYSEILRKGFVVVKATKEHHTAEFILFDTDTTLTDYSDARAASGALTASYSCDVSLVTTAGERGSLDSQEDCVIGFETARPVAWDIPVPISNDWMASDVTVLSDCDYNSCTFKAKSSKKQKKRSKTLKASKKPKHNKSNKAKKPKL